MFRQISSEDPKILVKVVDGTSRTESTKITRSKVNRANVVKNEEKEQLKQKPVINEISHHISKESGSTISWHESNCVDNNKCCCCFCIQRLLKKRNKIKAI